MLNDLRRRLDETATIVFLLIVLVLTIARPPVYATPGGLLLAQIVLWSAGILVAALLVAARFSPHARVVLHIILEIGPIVVAIVGYVSLKLLHVYDITAWLGIQPKDQWMMAADNFLLGKTPYLWFTQWGLQSRPSSRSCRTSTPCILLRRSSPWLGFFIKATACSFVSSGARC
jgi:hypothetical protein